MPELMKCGAFAHYCRTTKDTLIHYDRMGVLSPAKTAENGYRYYRADQLLELEIVETLQQSGMPLQEIKRLRTLPDRKEMLSTMEEQIRKMRRRARVLEAQSRLLSAFAASAAEMLSSPHGVLLFKDEPAISLRLFPAGDLSFLTDDEIAAGHAPCISWDREHAETVAPPSGIMLPEEDFRAGRFRPSALFARILPELEPRSREDGEPEAPAAFAPRTVRFPAGRRCTWLVKCKTTEQARELGRFRALLDDAGLEPAGPLFIWDEMNYLLALENDDRFELKFSAQVRKRGRGAPEA